MSEELKTCPFCGGEAEITKWHEGYFVECREQRCGGTIGAYKTEAGAIGAWNTRAERTCRAVDGVEYDDLLDIWTVKLSCGHVVHPSHNYVPVFCEVCGAKVQ